jgi:general secretion pathway protein A
MYNDYFGLKENPFSIAPDPHFLYLGARDREALAHFDYGIQVNGGFVQLTGEVGTGKTLLVRALLEKLPKEVEVALVLNPLISATEFVATICDELRIKYKKNTESIKELVDALNDHLLKVHAKGKRTVLIIDEAQNLNRDVLEQVRLLTNLETTKEKLLQIILVGQQELSQKLQSADLRQLAQRITARYFLPGLNKQETHAYISHRCDVAGAGRPLFSRAGMNSIYKYSCGNPRMINILCDRALLGAYSANESVVEPGAVRQAAKEVGDSVQGHDWFKKPAALAVAASVAVMVIGGGVFLNYKNSAVTESIAKTNTDTEVVVLKKQPEVLEKKEIVNVASDKSNQLGAILLKPETVSDTTSAFQTVFRQWGLANQSLTGRTGCDAAQDAGLRCVINTGNWSHLRNYNRPAVIELQDGRGQRHHIVVSHLDDNNVTLALGEKALTFPIVEVDKFWYGKYLLMWRPPEISVDTLKPGERSAAVVWLRQAIAWYKGTTPAETNAGQAASDLYDQNLASQVREFQRQHKLVVDGVVGQFTFMELNRYHPSAKPPLITKQLSKTHRTSAG